MYISRELAQTALRMAEQYPVVAITGPRQSGKTTLARSVFADKPYVSLEDLDERAFATEDPRGFLARFPDGAVLDEIQRAPGLLSYMQGIVDRDGRVGLFVLTGSQQFGLLASVTQSLAGRVSLLTLLPFSLGELAAAGMGPASLNELLFAGLYPPVHDRGLEPSTWYGNYLRTYVERDVRQLVNVQDLGSFERFVRLCAARTGQLLNLSGLAADCGVSHTTARSWISVLEASYVIHLLQPHHRNFSKRLIKTPKLYFIDTGLAAYLLNVGSPDQLATHSSRGSLFENWVLGELLKSRLNAAQASNLYFWRDRSGNEIDILIDRGRTLQPVEVKSGQTVASDFTTALERWRTLAGEIAGEPILVYGGDASYARSGVQFVGWRDVSTAIDPT